MIELLKYSEDLLFLSISRMTLLLNSVRYFQDSKICEYDIPKGSMIIPLQWAVHMDSRYWIDPEKFNPKRFLAEDGSLAKPEAFIPFQSGELKDNNYYYCLIFLVIYY